MDRFGEWRPIEPAADGEDGQASQAHKPAKPDDPAHGPETDASSVRLFGLLGAGVLAIVGVVIWIGSPTEQLGSGLELRAAAGFFDVATPPGGANGGSPASDVQTELVVDIQGAVMRPGVHRLAAGSRVGDAIASAGGYSSQVDIAAAAALLNLAAPLVDGAKVHVPARGEISIHPAASTVSLINVNSATSEQLDTLPGVGPVTAAKIIAARQQAPFVALDELVSRDVLGPSTLEKIRALITVGP